MADLLGGGEEIDFDRAASAFPDISLDGEGDIPSLPNFGTSTTSHIDAGFDIRDFNSAPAHYDVKVTDDDDGVIERFESDFPDIDVPDVRVIRVCCV